MFRVKRLRVGLLHSNFDQFSSLSGLFWLFRAKKFSLDVLGLKIPLLIIISTDKLDKSLSFKFYVKVWPLGRVILIIFWVKKAFMTLSNFGTVWKKQKY